MCKIHQLFQQVPSALCRMRVMVVALIVVVWIADQLSKHWALTHLSAYEPIPLFPSLNFTLGFNTGAAFGVLNGPVQWYGWFFVVFAIGMSAVLGRWVMRLSAHQWGMATALGLVIGGALGNVYDRLTIGHVIDFIDVYYRSHHWPIFNVADSAICVGVILLCWQEWRTTPSG